LCTPEAAQWKKNVLLWKALNPSIPLPWEISDRELEDRIGGRESTLEERIDLRRKMMLEKMEKLPKLDFHSWEQDELRTYFQEYFYEYLFWLTHLDREMHRLREFNILPIHGVRVQLHGSMKQDIIGSLGTI